MKAKYYLLGILILFFGHSMTAQDNPCGIEGIVVEVSNFQFAPAALEIEAGQTVIWVNVGGTHDVNGLSSTLGENWNNPEPFYISSVTGNTDGVCLGSHTFTVEGPYDYDCSVGYHAANGMVATITVNPAQSITTVVDVIVNSDDHTLLEAAIGAAGLVDALSDEGPFTVFAPTDEAFLALAEALDITMEELLAIPELTELLTYHVVAANAYTADFTNGQVITTTNGQEVTVSITADGVFINNAQILVADIVADNGVVHVIDEVLLSPPPEPESDIPFYEDFANGFAGNNGVGAWTAEDTGGGLIWQAVDAAGDGYFADGTASGVHPPAGEFSTNIAILSSTTADNGWIIYDNDYWNTPVSEGYSDNEGWLTSPNLNFSTNASVIVSWEQYFRYCCYSFAPLFLQVSADDGASWTTFDAHGSFEEKANTMSANGMTVTVDISCVAAYESNVMIRFAWLQPEETGEGYSHYFWGIDDITISESLVSDDLVAKQITTGDVADGFDYSVIPLEQFQDASNGGMLVGFMYKNIGEQNQLETEVLIEIVDESGAVINSTTEQIGTVVSQGNSEVCPVSEMDTVYISTGWAPSQTGEFLVRGTITSASVDATPSNNILEHSFFVSEDEMGHDISDVDIELIPGPNDIQGLYDPAGYGHFFQMTNAGSNAYGLAVKFGPNSHSASNTLQFVTRLYEMESVDELNTSAYTETLWSYDDWWTPSEIESGEWIYLPFGTPVSLQEDAFYFASIIATEANEGVLSVVANADADVDKAARIFGRNDSGEFEWQMESNDVPLIRLVFSPIEFSGCTDELACNYEEGATTDDGTCEYESCAGCMDQEACNFNSAATIDNPMACEFPEPNYDCFGACVDTEACVFVYPGTPYIQYEQGFEGLYHGDPVSQLTSWTTWSGESGTAEEALVSNVIARSGVNSLHIYSNEINVSLNNTLLLTGFDSGVYDLSFWMYIPDNASSSYNIQEELVPGIGEAFEVEFDWTGSASVFDSGEWAAEFSFPHDSWFKLTHIIDMDGNEIDFYVDDDFVVTRPFESNFGGVNFDSEGDGVSTHNCFVDDLEVSLVDGTPQACTYPGCQDPSASNYDASAGCEGECIYLTYDCASIGEPAWGNEAMGLFPDWQEAMHGVAWEGEWVFNVPATMIEPGSGVSYGVHHVDWLGMEGMPDWATATSFDAGEAMGPSTQHCIAAFGTPTAPGMHAITATGEVFISIFGQPFSIGEQSFSATLEVMANPNPILGCTYPLANNYLSYATLDDGSCEYLGCTDAEAANFNPFANVDDGSCGEACDPAGDSTCQADNDGDGVITVTDLLILLGEFGTECE